MVKKHKWDGWKIGSIINIVLFVMSLFASGIVFAEETSNNYVKNLNMTRQMPINKAIRVKAPMKYNETHLDLEQKRRVLLRIFKKLTPEERKALILMSKEDLEHLREKHKEQGEQNLRREILKKIKEREELEKKGWKIRKIAWKTKEEKLKKVKEHLKRVYERIKEHHKKEKEIWRLKKEYHECIKEAERNNNTTTNKCDNIKEQYINLSKSYLLNAVDTMITNLEAVKERIEASEYLNDTQIEEIVSKINERITALEQAKTSIQDCSSIECLRSQAIELNNEIKKAKLFAKIKIIEHEDKRVGLVNERANAILARLEILVEKAKAQNLSQEKMEKIEEKVAEIKEIINESKIKKAESDEYLEKAKEAFRQGNVEMGQEYIKESKELLKEAQEGLKDANEKLQEIWNIVKHHKKLRRLLVEKSDNLEEEEIEIEKENETD